MIQIRKSRSVQATEDGEKELIKAKAKKRNKDGKPWTFPNIAEAAGLDEKTVKSFFYRKAVDINSAHAIVQALDLQLADVIHASQLEPPTANSELEHKILIHRQTYKEMLTEKQRLTTNPLMTGGGTTFERGDVYVPLGLVERKRQPMRRDDYFPQEGSQLYAPTEYEVTRNFNNAEFFDFVLKQGISPKSQGKRIAIIGEPGAGKTTLLQQIADWVFEDTKADVAIWVSLADLQGRTIEEYLLNVWLKDAFQVARVTPEMEDSLVELFNRSRVWLLLDGVDEMSLGRGGPVAHPTTGNPLIIIASQLTTGWVSSARVVLTCRLNVWDAGKNALERFDTYRTLEFSYGDRNNPNSDQVNQFISNWFASSVPQLGKALRTALDQPGKERIKDLVKNPLRLSLMCYSWQLRQGELPKTKAALYKRFVEAFYEWKQECFPTTSATRKELNQALGRLAVNAISQSSSRFRLTRCFVSSVLGEPDTPLFQLTTQLGWLNQVGVAAEDPEEPVYAFYHPTFEEYFAACAIDDWHFFLNHISDNPSQGTYRVFKPQWKEVILLWLGREDVAKQQKEEFIKALVEFEDGCENFYWYQAYFLATALIAEFKDCSYAKELVEQLVQWTFSEKSSIPIIAWEARALLLETDCSRVTKLLRKRIDASHDEWSILIIAEILEKIYSENSKVINALYKLRESGQNQFINVKIAEILSKLETGNSKNHQIAEPVAMSYGNSEPTEVESINELIDLLSTSLDEYTCSDAIENLEKIATGNPDTIKILTRLLTNWNDKIALQAAKSLGKIDPGNLDAIQTLTKALRPRDYHTWEQATRGEEIRSTAAANLGEIGFGNAEAIRALIDVFHQTVITEVTHAIAAQSLEQIIQGDWFPVVVSSFKDFYWHEPERFQVLWHCAKKMSYSTFYETWHSQPSTPPEAADILPG